MLHSSFEFSDTTGVGVFDPTLSREFGPQESTAIHNFFAGAPVNPYSSMEMTFGSEINRLAFELQSNPEDDLNISVSLMSSGQLVEQFVIDTSGFDIFYFYGFETTALFDQVDFDVQTNANGAFSMDNLRFESTASPIPEPASILLIGLGLAGTLAGRRRRKSRIG